MPHIPTLPEPVVDASGGPCFFWSTDFQTRDVVPVRPRCPGPEANAEGLAARRAAGAKTGERSNAMHRENDKGKKRFPELFITYKGVDEDKPAGPGKHHLMASLMSGSPVWFPLVDTDRLLLWARVTGLVEAKASGFRVPPYSEGDFLRLWLKDVGLVERRVAERISRNQQAGFEVEPLKGGAGSVYDFLYLPPQARGCFGILTTFRRKTIMAGLKEEICTKVDLNDCIRGAKSVREHPDPESVWIAQAIPGVNMAKGGWHIDLGMFNAESNKWPYAVVRIDLGTQMVYFWKANEREWGEAAIWEHHKPSPAKPGLGSSIPSTTLSVTDNWFKVSLKWCPESARQPAGA